MLQQTQAPRVAELLPPFVDRFPSVEVLAGASTAEVIRAWKGLGYNNRAVRLRDAARRIVEEHDGAVPSDHDSLIALPGIGPYAAASIATFAFDVRTVVLDVNVRRVYSRLAEPQPRSDTLLDDTELKVVAEQLIPKRSSAAEWHHAVMDLGATICKARQTHCDQCPLASACPSAHSVAPVIQKRTAREPMFRGEPRRLWRGRVVEALRAHQDGLTQRVLVRTVLGDATTEESAFVADLIDRLAGDGIVERRGRRVRLCS